MLQRLMVGYSKKVATLVLAGCIALGGFLLPASVYDRLPEVAQTALVDTAQAATCHAYAHWFEGKSALYVWSPEGDHSIKAYFKFNNVLFRVKNSGKGILQNGPQRRSGGWAIYFISKTWRYTYWSWNDDWRWHVQGC